MSPDLINSPALGGAQEEGKDENDDESYLFQKKFFDSEAQADLRPKQKQNVNFVEADMTFEFGDND